MASGTRNLRLTGIPVVGGSRVGRAVLVEEAPEVVLARSSAPADVEAEVRRLQRGVEDAKSGLLKPRDAAESVIGEIFRAHAMMLDSLTPAIEAAIREGTSAEQAVAAVMHAKAQQFLRTKNAMLVQRSRDIVDLERRLLRSLAGLPGDAAPASAGEALHPVVVVARDLTPSETAALQGRQVAGIVLEEGGATSHTAVIAKSLQIPCVVGVEGITARVAPGDLLWVDGSRGAVVLEPDADSLAQARGLGERYERLEATLLAESDLPAETLDGHRAVLLANIEYPLDVEAGVARGAEGVGLFRTEFLYDAREGIPSEEEHLAAYRQTLARIGSRRLTVRTFDFGSDKERPGGGAREPNPALGVRSLRWCFEHPAPFRIQLRALLRVAAEGDVRIMLPMVGSLEELRRAKAMIRQVAVELAEQGLSHRPDPPVGIMIEIPAAALTADVLAPHVDFFSIGTNDLIQYDLAVDRMNPKVAPLFRPSHPSLLRLIRQTIDAATAHGKPVTMCGEMGGASIYTVLLLGMGIREFSLTPGYIPRARRLLRGLTLRQARQVAAQCMRLPTAEEVEAHLLQRVTPVGAG
jgi:phosphotransferase system enzyme I (PtsI)